MTYLNVKLAPESESEVKISENCHLSFPIWKKFSYKHIHFEGHLQWLIFKKKVCEWNHCWHVLYLALVMRYDSKCGATVLI